MADTTFARHDTSGVVPPKARLPLAMAGISTSGMFGNDGVEPVALFVQAIIQGFRFWVFAPFKTIRVAARPNAHQKMLMSCTHDMASAGHAVPESRSN